MELCGWCLGAQLQLKTPILIRNQSGWNSTRSGEGEAHHAMWRDVTPFVFDVKLDDDNSYVDWQDLNEHKGAGYVMRIGRGNGEYMAYSSEGGELSVPKQITLGDGRLVWEDGQLKFGKRRYSNGTRNSNTELAEIVTKANISTINAPYVKSVAKSDDVEYRVPFHKQETDAPGWSIYHDSVANDFTYNPKDNRLSVRSLSAGGDVSADTFTGGDFSGNGDAIKFTYDGTEYANLPSLLNKRLEDYTEATDNPYIRTSGHEGMQKITGKDLILEDTTAVTMYAGFTKEDGIDSAAEHEFHGTGGYIGYDGALGGYAGAVGPNTSSYIFRTHGSSGNKLHTSTDYKWGALMKYTEWSGSKEKNCLDVSVRASCATVDNVSPGDGTPDNLTTLRLQSKHDNENIGRYIRSNQKLIVTGAKETLGDVDKALGTDGFGGTFTGAVIHQDDSTGILRLVGSGTHKGAIHFADKSKGMKGEGNGGSGEVYYGSTGFNIKNWNGTTGTHLFRVDQNGKGHFKNDVVAFYSSFSDERLKKNITTLDSSTCLDTVCGLQAVEYEWKDTDEKHSGPQIGLIAQQVEAVEPRVVKHEQRGLEDETTYKQVEYDKLVPMLIESIKVLKERVEYLESQIK